ncbi:MAG: hypothetical protein QXQ53_01200 [Candidatus Methanosuratincola sp.]
MWTSVETSGLATRSYLYARCTTIEGAVQYNWRLIKSDASYESDYYSSSNETKFHNLTAGTTYRLSVRACGILGHFSSWSEEVEVTVPIEETYALIPTQLSVAQNQGIITASVAPIDRTLYPSFLGFRFYASRTPNFSISQSTLVQEGYSNLATFQVVEGTRIVEGDIVYVKVTAYDTSYNESPPCDEGWVYVGRFTIDVQEYTLVEDECFTQPRILRLNTNEYVEVVDIPQRYITLYIPTTKPETIKISVGDTISIDDIPTNYANKRIFQISDSTNISDTPTLFLTAMPYVEGIKVATLDVVSTNDLITNFLSLFRPTTYSTTVVTDHPIIWTPNLQATSGFKFIFISWNPPSSGNFTFIHLYRGTSPSFSSAILIGKLKGTGYFDNVGTYGTTRYYWIAIEDANGNVSSPIGPVSATTAYVDYTDINDFAIRASKIYTKIPIIEGDSWSDNSPSSGYVSWNSHKLYYNGTEYTINSGSTNLKYIYWTYGSSSYSTSNTNPTLGDNDFIIATNINGYHDLAWNAIANEVIGTAYIQNAAITNAKIESVAADKITAGTIGAQDIYVGDTTFKLSGTDKQILIKDAQVTPKKRVELGKIGTGSSDYGLKLYDENENVTFEASKTIKQRYMKFDTFFTCKHVSTLALDTTNAYMGGDICVDSSGNMYFVFEGTSDRDIYKCKLERLGYVTIDVSSFITDSTYTLHSSTIATDNSYLYVSYVSSADYDIRWGKYNTSFTPVISPSVKFSDSSVNFLQLDSTCDSSGNTYLVWSGNNYTLYGGKINSSGTVLISTTALVSGSSNYPRPKVCWDGTYLYVLYTYISGSTWTLYVRKFDSSFNYVTQWTVETSSTWIYIPIGIVYDSDNQLLVVVYSRQGFMGIWDYIRETRMSMFTTSGTQITGPAILYQNTRLFSANWFTSGGCGIDTTIDVYRIFASCGDTGGGPLKVLTLSYRTDTNVTVESSLLNHGLNVLTTICPATSVTTTGDLNGSIGSSVDYARADHSHGSCCAMKVGTYIGDGTDNRNIDIGIDLANATYAYVMIKDAAANNAVFRTSAHTGDTSSQFGTVADVSNRIQAFTTTGFQIGSNVDVNASDHTYRYVVIYQP